MIMDECLERRNNETDLQSCKRDSESSTILSERVLSRRIRRGVGLPLQTNGGHTTRRLFWCFATTIPLILCSSWAPLIVLLLITSTIQVPYSVRALPVTGRREEILRQFEVETDGVVTDVSVATPTSTPPASEKDGRGVAQPYEAQRRLVVQWGNEDDVHSLESVVIHRFPHYSVEPQKGYLLPHPLHADGTDATWIRRLLHKSVRDYHNSDGRQQQLQIDSPDSTQGIPYPFTYYASVAQIEKGFVEFFQERVVVMDESRVFANRGCTEANDLRNWEGMMVTGDGSLVWSNPSMQRKALHRFHSLAVLVDGVSNTYSDWILEMLPRLLLYRETFQRVANEGARGSPSHRAFYLVENKPYVRETLRLLGIQEHNEVVFFEPGAVYFADQLFLASSLPCRAPPRPILYGLRNTMFNAFFPPISPAIPLKRKRLMLERRQKASEQNLILLVQERGKIINIDQVAQVIRSTSLQNQEIVLVDKHLDHGAPTGAERPSFVSQYSLFRRAQIVIAPHGSSLGNLLWCQEGVNVVEFLPHLREDEGLRTDPLYAVVAGGLNISYYAVPVEVARLRDAFHAPLHELRNIMQRVNGVEVVGSPSEKTHEKLENANEVVEGHIMERDLRDRKMERTGKGKVEGDSQTQKEQKEQGGIGAKGSSRPQKPLVTEKQRQTKKKNSEEGERKERERENEVRRRRKDEKQKEEEKRRKEREEKRASEEKKMAKKEEDETKRRQKRKKEETKTQKKQSSVEVVKGKQPTSPDVTRSSPNQPPAQTPPPRHRRQDKDRKKEGDNAQQQRLDGKQKIEASSPSSKPSSSSSSSPSSSPSPEDIHLLVLQDRRDLQQRDLRLAQERGDIEATESLQRALAESQLEIAQHRSAQLQASKRK